MGKIIKQRDVGLDLTRIIAFLSVVGVHLLHFAGFWVSCINSKGTYVMVFMVTFFRICVPLFMVITGYLYVNKEIPLEKKSLKKFYWKLSKIILTYVIATCFILIFQKVYQNQNMGIRKIVTNITGYMQYSWYVNMYIGLFLLIPILNLLWKSIETKQGHLTLVIIFVVITILPSFFNGFDLVTKGALLKPWIGKKHYEVFPNWWTGIYPITYYYVGAYIRKHVDVKKLNTKKLFAIFLAVFVFFGFYNIWRSYTRHYQDCEWNNWNGFQTFIITVLFFVLINSINFSKLNKASRVFSFISELTFGAYLVSWIPDQYYHKKLIEYSSNITKRYLHSPIIYLKIVFISLGLAFVIDCIVKILFKLKEIVFSNKYNSKKSIDEKNKQAV